MPKKMNQDNPVVGYTVMGCGYCRKKRHGEKMTKRLKDSMAFSFAVVTGIATVFTILGGLMKDILPLSCVQIPFLSVVLRALVLLVIYVVLTGVIWLIIGCTCRKMITVKIGHGKVTVKLGNLFEQNAWRVIAVDTHFDTVVDDKVISKKSLHGQLVLEHGDVAAIKEAVEEEAKRRELQPSQDGRYTFPLGTAIPYRGKDGHYIMVALTELDDNLEAHTRMPQYENTLMAIWKEVSRVYAGHDLALPILGAGITRFDDGQDEPSDLLRCMLCTLKISKIHFKSDVSIIVYDGGNAKVSLYEYKDLYRFAE